MMTREEFREEVREVACGVLIFFSCVMLVAVFVFAMEVDVVVHKNFQASREMCKDFVIFASNPQPRLGDPAKNGPSVDEVTAAFRLLLQAYKYGMMPDFPSVVGTVAAFECLDGRLVYNLKDCQ